MRGGKLREAILDLTTSTCTYALAQWFELPSGEVFFSPAITFSDVRCSVPKGAAMRHSPKTTNCGRTYAQPTPHQVQSLIVANTKDVRSHLLQTNIFTPIQKCMTVSPLHHTRIQLMVSFSKPLYVRSCVMSCWARKHADLFPDMDRSSTPHPYHTSANMHPSFLSGSHIHFPERPSCTP